MAGEYKNLSTDSHRAVREAEKQDEQDQRYAGSEISVPALSECPALFNSLYIKHDA